MSRCSGGSLKSALLSWEILGKLERLWCFLHDAFLLLPGKSQVPGPLEGVCHQHAGRGQDL